MGIHPYGLFGTYESNNLFGPDYEIRHQLDARKAQLDALSRKSNLSDKDLAKKEQLSKAVNTLNSRLEDGVIYTKNYSEGSVIAKPFQNNVTSNTPSPDSYLKGFFVDLKI